MADKMYYTPPVNEAMGGMQFNGIVSDLAEWIPADPANRHWIEYQDWLAEGNTPEPYPPEGITVPPPEQVTPGG